MPLLLVIHRPPEPPGSDADAACRTALRDAVWEVAESHWTIGAEALLAASDLSPGYLLAHFKAGLTRRGFPDPGVILVVPVGADAARVGLPAEAEAWMGETL
jgi:hypothetical protein